MKSKSREHDIEWALITIHAPNIKLSNFDWGSHEWIEYCPERGIIDESGQEVNAAVFVLNAQGWFIYE